MTLVVSVMVMPPPLDLMGSVPGLSLGMLVMVVITNNIIIVNNETEDKLYSRNHY